MNKYVALFGVAVLGFIGIFSDNWFSQVLGSFFIFLCGAAMQEMRDGK